MYGNEGDVSGPPKQGEARKLARLSTRLRYSFSRAALFRFAV